MLRRRTVLLLLLLLVRGDVHGSMMMLRRRSCRRDTLLLRRRHTEMVSSRSRSSAWTASHEAIDVGGRALHLSKRLRGCHLEFCTSR